MRINKILIEPLDLQFIQKTLFQPKYKVESNTNLSNFILTSTGLSGRSGFTMFLLKIVK